MPKSAKRKKERAQDFGKAKLKLGKGKKAPTNAIDTSFKARSIALPQQSITIEKRDVGPTTRRGQGLGDLLPQLKHYSAGVRKDAIAGIRELMESDTDFVNTNLTTVLGTTSKLIVDEDPSVRAGLLHFFQWLLPRIPHAQLIPHAPNILLFATSAQTHIFPEVRVDAIRFLDVFMEVFPDQVVTGWRQIGSSNSSNGSRVLDGYLGILNAKARFLGEEGAGQASTSTGFILSSKSKSLVLNSLSHFVTNATSRESLAQPKDVQDVKSLPTWYIKPLFYSPESFEAFESLLQPCRTSPDYTQNLRIITPEDNPEDDLFAENFPLLDLECNLESLHEMVETVVHELRCLDAGANASGFAADRRPQALPSSCRALHPTLLATFLDCAPVVFAPAGVAPEEETRLLLSVANTVRDLYSTLFVDESDSISDDLRQALCDSLGEILSHMAPYFPFGEGKFVAQDAKTEQLLRDLSLVYCELTSLLSLILARPASSPNSDPSRIRKDKRKPRNTAAVQEMSTVSDYVTRSLQGNVKTVANPVGQALSSASYVALLPTLWQLINDSTTSAAILTAVLEHGIKISASSAVKQKSVEFIARLALLRTDPYAPVAFKSRWGVDEDSKLRGWVLHLPKTLWELGGSNPRLTEIILLFLLRFYQRKPSIANADFTTALTERFNPFFIMQHRTKGEVAGPYSKLSNTHLRRLVLDVVVTLGLPHGPAAALRANVEKAVKGTGEAAYWKSILQSR